MIKSYPDAAQRPGTLRPAPPAVVELAGVERLTAAGGSGSALIRVDLAIAAGETVAITGPSGSGSAVPE